MYKRHKSNENRGNIVKSRGNDFFRYRGICTNFLKKETGKVTNLMSTPKKGRPSCGQKPKFFLGNLKQGVPLGAGLPWAKISSFIMHDSKIANRRTVRHGRHGIC